MSTTAPTIPLGTGVKVMTLVVQTNNNAATTYLLPQSGTPFMSLNRIRKFFLDLVNGAWKSNVTVIQGGVYATGTAVCASVTSTNTLVIGGVTITAVASNPTSVQFVAAATDAGTAANIVTTINALTTLNKVVQATSSGATVTIASLVPGTIGNLITLSAGGGTITVGAALTGGTDGTKGNISHGL
jgi:hypothetical protein